MTIGTTFLRRCIETLEIALGEIEKHREAATSSTTSTARPA